jgi:hypothetical protein
MVISWSDAAQLPKIWSPDGPTRRQSASGHMRLSKKMRWPAVASKPQACTLWPGSSVPLTAWPNGRAGAAARSTRRKA